MAGSGYGSSAYQQQPPAYGQQGAVRSPDLILSEDDMLNQGIIFIEPPTATAMTELLNTIYKIRTEQGKFVRP